MARSDSRVQRVLPGARDSGKLARIGRLSDMALEAQWVSSLGRILSIGYQVWSVTDASVQFSPVRSENLRVRQSYIFAIRLPDESSSISTALAPLREATHDAIRAGDAIAAECKGISFPL